MNGFLGPVVCFSVALLLLAFVVSVSSPRYEGRRYTPDPFVHSPDGLSTVSRLLRYDIQICQTPQAHSS